MSGLTTVDPATDFSVGNLFSLVKNIEEVNEKTGEMRFVQSPVKLNSRDYDTQMKMLIIS